MSARQHHQHHSTHHHHHHHHHHHSQTLASGAAQLQAQPQTSLEATTLEDCKRKQTTSLRLLRVPDDADLRDLTHLTHLNLSECDLSEDVDALRLLPTSLQQLHLTACHLSSLPACLTRLTELKQLYAGANRITDLTVLTRMPWLQHAGLSYNSIQHLPAAQWCEGCAGLLSLDVSHCQMDDLHSSVRSLLAMPSLQLLSLAGNPFCLLPSYQHVLKSTLYSKLMLLDGQRVDQAGMGRTVAPSASIPPRPPDINLLWTALSSSPQNEAQHPMLAMLSKPVEPGSEAPVTLLSVELGPLEVLEDPWAALRASWEAQAACEAAAAAAAAATAALAAIQAAAAAPPSTPPPRTSQATQSTSAVSPSVEDPAAAPLVTVPTEAEALAMTTAAAAEEAAALAAAAAAAVPTGPLQPYVYHFEVEACDGSSISAGMKLDNRLGSVTESQVAAACQAVAMGTGTDQQEEVVMVDTIPTGPADSGEMVETIPAVHSDLVETISQWDYWLQGAATQYCSIPCRVAPPQAPTKPGTPEPVASQAVGKAKGKDVKAAKPVKGAKPSTPQAVAAAGQLEVMGLQRGGMKLQLQLPASLQARDWLLHGIRVRLYRTQIIAVQRPPSRARTPTPEPTTTKPTKQTGKGKQAAAAAAVIAESTDVRDAASYDMQAKTQLVAEGIIPAGPFVSGNVTRLSQPMVTLIPVPRLWDEKGVRMPLKDPRHQQQPIASLAASLALHVLPPGVTLPDEDDFIS